MGMYDNIRDVVKVFRFDEELNRLLYYPPENMFSDPPVLDPLDSSLPNVLELDEDWAIRDDTIMTIAKADDLENKALCRVYIYAGRRNPQSQNYAAAHQELIIDVLCHSEFEKDLRSMRISDRVNQLLVHERITGLGKMDYSQGSPISAPNNYIGYRHIYSFGATKR